MLSSDQGAKKVSRRCGRRAQLRKQKTNTPTGVLTTRSSSPYYSSESVSQCSRLDDGTLLKKKQDKTRPRPTQNHEKKRPQSPNENDTVGLRNVSSWMSFTPAPLPEKKLLQLKDFNGQNYTHVKASTMTTVLANVIVRLKTNAGRCTQLCHPLTTAVIAVVTTKPDTTASCLREQKVQTKKHGNRESERKKDEKRGAESRRPPRFTVAREGIIKNLKPFGQCAKRMVRETGSTRSAPVIQPRSLLAKRCSTTK